MLYTVVILIVRLLVIIKQNNIYFNGGAETSAFRVSCVLRCSETLRSVGCS